MGGRPGPAGALGGWGGMGGHLGAPHFQMLTVTGLTKRFGGFTALNAVSFEVREGEILGLIGPNGSGKTTAFNCISGALPLTAGSIKLRRGEIYRLPPRAIFHPWVSPSFPVPQAVSTLPG